MSKQCQRISWLDSTGQPSLIHATVDGKTTVCGGHDEYISNRHLIKAPSKIKGFRNYCRICFKDGGKVISWDKRCKQYDVKGDSNDI